MQQRPYSCTCFNLCTFEKGVVQYKIIFTGFCVWRWGTGNQQLTLHFEQCLVTTSFKKKIVLCIELVRMKCFL